MCVIAIAETKRLTAAMVDKMFTTNPQGAGIAWRELATVGEEQKVVVKWKKGLDQEEITQLCQALPLPYVAHFRIPTSGAAVKELCHPFPIQNDVSVNTHGTTDGYVLFHNGHWTAWRNTMLESVIHGVGKVPNGYWSDSRAMAWVAAHYGLSVLELLNEKACAFGPDKIEVFQPTTWSKENNIWVSNTSWNTKQWVQCNDNDWDSVRTMCRDKHCCKAPVPHSLYCADHIPKRMCATVQCPKREAHNSGYCEDHQHIPASWLCRQSACIKAHTQGSAFCEEHDRNRLPEVKPTSSPFRQIGAGKEAVAGRDHEQQEVQKGKEGLRQSDAVTREGADILAFKWARALNPKGGATSIRQEDVVRQERSEKAAKGIIIVGPL